MKRSEPPLPIGAKFFCFFFSPQRAFRDNGSIRDGQYVGLVRVTRGGHHLPGRLPHPQHCACRPLRPVSQVRGKKKHKNFHFSIKLDSHCGTAVIC